MTIKIGDVAVFKDPNVQQREGTKHPVVFQVVKIDNNDVYIKATRFVDPIKSKGRKLKGIPTQIFKIEMFK